MEANKMEQEKPYCLIAVTQETTKSGKTWWVVWHNNEAIAEEESAVAALAIARAIIVGI